MALSRYNLKRHVPCVRHAQSGVAVVDEVQLETLTAAPSDSDLAVGRMYCDGSTIYGYNGSSFVDMMTTSTINISAWETLYAADTTLDITGATLTFAGAHATNDVFTITNASGSGDCLQITNSGTGKDINGTSSKWSVTKAGVYDGTDATLDSITVGSGSAAGVIDSSGNYNLTLQTGNATTADITIVDGNNGDVDITLQGTGAVNINGTTTANDALVIAAGDMSITDGSITLTDADNAAALSVTTTGNSNAITVVADSVAAGNAVDINVDALADGWGLHIDSTNGASFGTGGYFQCYNGSAAVFSIVRYGATTIAGNGGTTVLTLTAGDAVMSDGSLAITDDDDADSFTVTNDSAAANGMVVFAGSGTYTGNTTSAFFALAPSGLTTGTAMYLATDTITTGKFIHLAQAGEALTSGEMLDIDNTESGNLATKTGNLCSITSSLTETSTGNITENYDMLLLSRTDVINDGTTTATYTAQGSALKILHTSTQTASTLTDSVIALEVEQSGATALGHAVQVTNVGATGSAINVVSANVGAADVLVTSSGAHTNGYGAVNITTSGDLATGGANLILTVSGSSCNAAARCFEIDAQKDVYAAYIDTDAVTNDAIYVTHSGNLAAGKAVMHITDGGIPAADNVYVLHAAFAGTATNESSVIFADGGGKDVTGLYVDCDCVDSAGNVSAQVALYSDAAGNLPVLMQFYHSDAGAGDGEIQARINFYGSDDAPAKELYAKIEVESDDVTAANPDGILWIYGDLAGSITASAGFTGNKVMLGAAASTLTTAGSWDLTLSTNSTAANEPKIVMTDGATGDITITAGGTSGEVVLASPMQRESSVGVTADVGSAQGNGAFTEDILEISTCGTTGDAVTLPGAEAGKVIFIINRGANAADVFPASGDNINEVGANTAKALAADAGMICIGIDATHWEAWTMAR